MITAHDVTLTDEADRVPKFTVGERMAKARESINMTQAELADALGISRQSLTNYEQGHHRPLRAIWRAWLKATGVNEHWLETGCECRSPEASTCRLTVGCAAIAPRGTIPSTVAGMAPVYPIHPHRSPGRVVPLIPSQRRS